jgi:betaine-aldehyde dehydrogenase
LVVYLSSLFFLDRGGTFKVYNPATNEIIAEVANATAADVDIAVKVAKRTLYSQNWGYKSTGAQRAAILRALQQVIIRRKDEIASLDSYDMGKPFREAQADLGDAISACDHFANLAEAQDKHQDEVRDVSFLSLSSYFLLFSGLLFGFCFSLVS